VTDLPDDAGRRAAGNAALAPGCMPGSSAPDGTELERLLTQLIRLIGPAVGDGAATPGSESSVVPDQIPAVSASEARALIELMTARGIAQGELGGLLGLEKSTVSRLAAGLERKGWIRRGRDEGNQRYIRLYLTSAGGAVAARLWHSWHSRQTRILAGLSPEERAGLLAGLRGLVRVLAADSRPSESGEGADRMATREGRVLPGRVPSAADLGP
jgi:DNA-binding MarR family transcriptional regulator